MPPRLLMRRRHSDKIMKIASPRLLSVFEPVRSARFENARSEERIPVFSRNEQRVTAPESTGAAFKKILVPMTLARESQNSLVVASSVARKSRAQLVLLHVVQLNIAGEERGIHRTRLLSELQRTAESELRQLAYSLGDHVTTEVIVSDGRPAEVIVQTAEKIGADAIVMAVQPHSRWLRWLHRNTALHVVRKAPCAVMWVSTEERGPERKRFDPPRRISEKYSKDISSCEHAHSGRSLLRVLFS